MGGVAKTIGKVTGSIPGGIGPMAGGALGPMSGVANALDPAAIKKMLDGMPAGASGDPKISGLVGGFGGGLAPLLEKVLVGAALKQDTGAAFNAILLATVDRVNGKPNFNLELEINDLLVKLGNLRDPAMPAVGPSGASGEISGKVQATMKSIADMLASQGAVLKAAASNVR